MKISVSLAYKVMSLGLILVGANAFTSNTTRVAESHQATCKVSPDHTIMKCTYVGKDSYGNSIY